MRIYFCSDIHASEKCWRKVLATPKFYDADVIIVGGDVTGKFVVPIVKRDDGRHVARFLGVERRCETVSELATLKRRIADAGQYATIITQEEYEDYKEDRSRVDELFKRLVMERMNQWVEMADEKLKETGVRCLVSGGNDDFFEVDDILKSSEFIEDPNGRVVELGGGIELLGMGYGNPTPWPCPRDISEEELYARIEAVAEKVRDPHQTIFSLHVPPLGSRLDLAPRLDADLRMVLNAGGADMIPVGSTATRDAVIKYRPMLGLHGHIHESKGIRKLEGVTVANPGSEYGEGILDGLLVDIDERGRGLVNVQLVTG